MRRVVVLLLALCATARADNPAVDEVQETVLALRVMQGAVDDSDVADALELLALPFQMVGGQKACKREWKLAAHGTFVTTDNAARFLRCLAESGWTHSIDGPTGDFFELVTVPPGFLRYKKQIRALQKTHIVVASHFCPAAPGTYWTIYGARRGSDGKLRIDTLMIWSDPEGACR